MVKIHKKIIWLTKKKFSKAPIQKKKFQFTGLEPKMEYKGNPYESIKDI
jgi:hypothetical protein